ncbi:MAG: hypothetical protein Q4G23_10630 [Clostridia bacterium]|nr:hypothetical protein [Clostridia bacterium]
MLAVALGYPLGTMGDKYLVERSSKGAQLSFQEAAVWMNFNGIKEIKDIGGDKETILRLASSGLIAFAQTTDELLVKLSEVIPVRQGAGTLENGVPAIFLGDRSVKAEDAVLNIWKLCNGKRRIGDICQFAERDYKKTREEYLEILSFLKENDLIFFT